MILTSELSIRHLRSLGVQESTISKQDLTTFAYSRQTPYLGENLRVLAGNALIIYTVNRNNN